MFQSLLYDHPQGSSSVLSAFTTFPLLTSSFAFSVCGRMPSMCMCVQCTCLCVVWPWPDNPQTANRILPSSYLFWAVKRLVDYLYLSYSFKREKHGETEKVQPALSVGWSLYYTRKSIGQAPTAGEQTQQKPCRKSSDIGAELENNTVGRCPI
jgi:hypothetical protein